ncbi:transcription antitermination factor NusB [Bifidobacterium aquikefiricola]|uniref:Transcription antitermination protein NusB n=1 Tax=Bifidobacterium aquikefiricola TaxID=3059038 RepID=A0AB39U8C1_9BIFI
MARSTARKRALNTLYEADEKGQEILSLLAERLLRPGAQTPLPDYAIDLVRGVAEHLHTIDNALDDHSTGWKINRMAVVDRNILRIAAWEIVFNPDVPDRVAIDEALSLAKTLSDSDAPAFIHGLLSAVSTDKEQILIADSKRAESEQTDSEQTDSDSAEGVESESNHTLAQGRETEKETDIDSLPFPTLAPDVAADSATSAPLPKASAESSDDDTPCNA